MKEHQLITDENELPQGVQYGKFAERLVPVHIGIYACVLMCSCIPLLTVFNEKMVKELEKRT